MSVAIDHSHLNEEAGGLRPLTQRDCLQRMIFPALALAVSPVVILQASSAPSRLFLVGLMLWNAVGLRESVRQWRRLRRGERILVPTFEALAPTQAPSWLAAGALGALTAITLCFALVTVMILVAGAHPNVILILFCLLTPVIALNVLGWRRLLFPRRRSAAANAATARQAAVTPPAAVAPVATSTAAAPPGPRHWWTDTGTREEIIETRTGGSR